MEYTLATCPISWDHLIEAGTEVLEDEALRRARDGTDKPIYQGGKKVGSVREYSDTLLIFLLKARNPAKYRERIDAHVTGDVKVNIVNFTGEPMGTFGPDQAPAIEHDGDAEVIEPKPVSPLADTTSSLVGNTASTAADEVTPQIQGDSGTQEPEI